MCYKENKSLFFDVREHAQVFTSIPSHFLYDHRCVFSTEMGDIRMYKEVRQQKFVEFRMSG